MTTLTPCREGVEKMLLELDANIARQLARGAGNETSARLVKAILPTIMRAVADEIDREVPFEQVMVGMEFAFANSTLSVARTMANAVDVDTEALATAFAVAILERTMQIKAVPKSERIITPVKKPQGGEA